MGVGSEGLSYIQVWELPPWSSGRLLLLSRSPTEDDRYSEVEGMTRGGVTLTQCNLSFKESRSAKRGQPYCINITWPEQRLGIK
jgi:hypothetical protein